MNKKKMKRLTSKKYKKGYWPKARVTVIVNIRIIQNKFANKKEKKVTDRGYGLRGIIVINKNINLIKILVKNQKKKQKKINVLLKKIINRRLWLGVKTIVKKIINNKTIKNN